jgi:hypothetical protein
MKGRKWVAWKCACGTDDEGIDTILLGEYDGNGGTENSAWIGKRCDSTIARFNVVGG